jgi:hypothetical protein
LDRQAYPVFASRHAGHDIGDYRMSPAMWRFPKAPITWNRSRPPPWCVGRVDVQLRLAPGVPKETNGIALLADRGFDAAISAKANRVHDWLSGYMAHPVDCEAVLGLIK